MEIEHKIGDCREVLKEYPENHFDSCVTDPPYGLEFMGREWDRFSGLGFDPAFCHWFAGFVDGEGCFSIHKKPQNTFDCQFHITLRIDDIGILETIKKELGIGTIAIRKREGNDQARYTISSKAECNLLREIFKAFPLRAKKANDFKLWSDALDEWLAHQRGEWEEMEKIRDELMASRKCDSKGIRISSYQMWTYWWAKEVYRVLKPGAHLLAFGGTRTHHRMVCAVEDAGFEIRDTIGYIWVYGTGFPKSMNISKQIDKMAGADRKVVGKGECGYQVDIAKRRKDEGYRPGLTKSTKEFDITAPATPDAEKWEGWGTALKPALEPIVVARKPISEKNVASNVLKYGTGGINVDDCRIVVPDKKEYDFNRRGFHERADPDAKHPYEGGWKPRTVEVGDIQGRFPANLILECICEEVIAGSPGEVKNLEGKGGIGGYGTYHGAKGYNHKPVGPMYNDTPPIHTNPNCPCYLLDEQTGELQPCGSANVGSSGLPIDNKIYGDGFVRSSNAQYVGQKGGPSRFFYIAKASRKERYFYCQVCEKAFPGDERKEHMEHAKEQDKKLLFHVTQKPERLMRYLIRLVTPKDGTILDPFVGSGTTLVAAKKEGFNCIGIDISEEYEPIVKARLKDTPSI